MSRTSADTLSNDLSSQLNRALTLPLPSAPSAPSSPSLSSAPRPAKRRRLDPPVAAAVPLAPTDRLAALFAGQSPPASPATPASPSAAWQRASPLTDSCASPTAAHVGVVEPRRAAAVAAEALPPEVASGRLTSMAEAAQRREHTHALARLQRATTARSGAGAGVAVQHQARCFLCQHAARADGRDYYALTLINNFIANNYGHMDDAVLAAECANLAERHVTAPWLAERRRQRRRDLGHLVVDEPLLLGAAGERVRGARGLAADLATDDDDDAEDDAETAPRLTPAMVLEHLDNSLNPVVLQVFCLRRAKDALLATMEDLRDPDTGRVDTKMMAELGRNIDRLDKLSEKWARTAAAAGYSNDLALDPAKVAAVVNRARLEPVLHRAADAASPAAAAAADLVPDARPAFGAAATFIDDAALMLPPL